MYQCLKYETDGTEATDLTPVLLFVFFKPETRIMAR